MQYQTQYRFTDECALANDTRLHTAFGGHRRAAIVQLTSGKCCNLRLRGLVALPRNHFRYNSLTVAV